MQKKKNDTNQSQTLSSLIGSLRELQDSPGWKLLEKEIDFIIGELKEKLWIPCSDESMKYNARNLIAERLSVLFVIKNIPQLKIDDLKIMLEQEKESAMPLQERLELHNKKLSDELRKQIKL